MTVWRDPAIKFATETGIAIIGGGACGLVAALAAKEAGAEVFVFERDKIPAGSTALSSGMVPACGTRIQAAKGVEDSVAIMASDIQCKAEGGNDSVMVETICRESGPAIDWLEERHGVPLTLVEGFHYPGHSRLRMHAPPSRTGAALMASLLDAAVKAEIDIVTEARAVELHADHDARIRGFGIRRPDGRIERVACRALILACNGFGGNRDMVRRYLPEVADADYFGHAGNQGDALIWGEDLGARLSHMGAYQGHGSVASPHAILMTWALIMEGGFQVNAKGERFSDETHGYSEQAVKVLAQPGRFAWDIYDARIHALGMTFEDYRNAFVAGAIRSADTIEELADGFGLPRGTLAKTLEASRRPGRDRWGRDFQGKAPREAPFYGVKVTGALFHTQGGLAIDPSARVKRRGGGLLPNLLAGGGAAAGISGETVSGYLSGNGLLSAVTLGCIAGRTAASLAR